MHECVYHVQAKDGFQFLCVDGRFSKKFSHIYEGVKFWRIATDKANGGENTSRSDGRSSAASSYVQVLADKILANCASFAKILLHLSNIFPYMVLDYAHKQTQTHTHIHRYTHAHTFTETVRLTHHTHTHRQTYTHTDSYRKLQTQTHTIILIALTFLQ